MAQDREGPETVFQKESTTPNRHYANNGTRVRKLVALKKIKRKKQRFVIVADKLFLLNLDLGFPFFNTEGNPVDLTLVDNFGDKDDVRTMTPLPSDSESDSDDVDSSIDKISGPSKSRYHFKLSDD
jgi:hypothetical protein